jgi:hypothetical protein
LLLLGVREGEGGRRGVEKQIPTIAKRAVLYCFYVFLFIGT